MKNEEVDSRPGADGPGDHSRIFGIPTLERHRSVGPNFSARVFFFPPTLEGPTIKSSCQPFHSTRAWKRGRRFAGAKVAHFVFAPNERPVPPTVTHIQQLNAEKHSTRKVP